MWLYLLHTYSFFREKFIDYLIDFLVLIHALLPLFPAELLLFLFRQVPQTILIYDLISVLNHLQMLLLLDLVEFEIVAVPCDLLLVETQQVAQATLHQLAQILVAIVRHDLHRFVENELDLVFEFQEGVLILALLAGKLEGLIIAHQFFDSLLFCPREWKLFEMRRRGR